MKKDIQNRDDIAALVNRFYEAVRRDPLLGPVFDETAKVNWDMHLPRMYDFWEHVLFQADTYSGNPMRVHTILNGRVTLSAQHFERWIILFMQALDELFSGEVTELARQRALSIATVMKLKMLPAERRYSGDEE